ncbi:acyltransferase family protein [Delftia tsuruhatensis]
MDKNSHPSNNFDFLRIFAASLVLYSHHYALSGLPTSGLLGMYTWGGVAVLIFFSISGYLVAQSWFADPHIGRFFLRRILRIWPALTFIVIFCTFILGPSVTTLSMQDYFGHPETLGYLKLLYMETRFTLPGVFQNNPALPTVNGSLWTIPYEVICYILLGSLGFIGLLNSKKSLLAIAAAYLIWYAFKRLPTSAADIHAKQEFIAFFLSGSALYALQDIWSKHKKKSCLHFAQLQLFLFI